MKKEQKIQRKALVLDREVLSKLQDDTLASIAGGCNQMPPSCLICPTTPITVDS